MRARSRYYELNFASKFCSLRLLLDHHVKPAIKEKDRAAEIHAEKVAAAAKSTPTEKPASTKEAAKPATEKASAEPVGMSSAPTTQPAV